LKRSSSLDIRRHRRENPVREPSSRPGRMPMGRGETALPPLGTVDRLNLRWFCARRRRSLCRGRVRHRGFAKGTRYTKGNLPLVAPTRADAKLLLILSLERVHVEDPFYHQKFTFHIYEIRSSDQVVRFAAGAFSNCMWGFFARHSTVEPAECGQLRIRAPVDSRMSLARRA
jgi:hypothetical protein